MQRRSIWTYLRQFLGFDRVSQLLWIAQGITDDSEYIRTALSAGAVYHMEVCAVVSHNSVDKIGTGVYLIRTRGAQFVTGAKRRLEKY